MGKGVVGFAVNYGACGNGSGIATNTHLEE
jgi:hypothetical protein